MVDYIPITEAQSDPEAAVDSSLIKRLRDNPIAIAEGAAGAPRIFGDAMGLLVADVDPAGMSSVTFTDILSGGFVFEFERIRPDTTSNTILRMQSSRDNGATFTSTTNISIGINWQNTGGRLGGLSGFIQGGNLYAKAFTFLGIPDSQGTADSNETDISLHQENPFVPVNAVRFLWSLGNFDSAANQKIRLYQNVYRREIKP